jgi:1,2-diacylglycerol 3-alpha-glucosyltransferase
MKILHCCLAVFYADDYGYQENVLPKMHKLQGHDVKIIASTETYINNQTLGYTEAKKYLSSDGIPVVRLPYLKFLPHFVARKLRVYPGLLQEIENFSPDVIFLHDTQFLSIRTIVAYAQKYKVRVYADCHTDLVNSARNWVSKNILHGIIYKYCVQQAQKVVRKFYGTTPLRSDFLIQFYGVDPQMVELLPIGVDDSEIDTANRGAIRTKLRSSLNLENDDLVVISGGKVDLRKNIHNLIEAVNSFPNEKLKLIIVGSITPEVQEKIKHLKLSTRIKLVGWKSPREINEYLFAGDLAFFPGTHSVLWEQSVGLGLPAVFKRWEGITHTDLGGNCLFIKEGTISEITGALTKILEDKQLYDQMKQTAELKGAKAFTYSEIAKRAIEVQ